jgi:uncharacterized LabA/DUF88 family protein
MDDVRGRGESDVRAQKLAESQGTDLSDAAAFFYQKDVYFWPERQPAAHWIVYGRGINAPWTKRFHGNTHAERAYYYTCTQGDQKAVNKIHDDLASRGFSPTVMHKPKGARAKGVDISLTKDMLLQAFLGNYDIAVLVSGDGDYKPVVEEVRRFGKWVIVAFFDEANGLSPDLRRAADEYVPFTLDGR